MTIPMPDTPPLSSEAVSLLAALQRRHPAPVYYHQNRGAMRELEAAGLATVAPVTGVSGARFAVTLASRRAP